MNQSGDMISNALSNGHAADIKMVEHLVKGLNAKLYADRGYISQNLKQSLKEQGIELITYHCKNMQAVKLSKADAHNCSRTAAGSCSHPLVKSLWRNSL